MPATLVFDHPTPVALAAHLAAELSAGTVGGTVDADPSPAAGGQGPLDTLAGMFRLALEQGRMGHGLDLLLDAAKLRPTFDGAEGSDAMIAPVRLARADGDRGAAGSAPELVCFVSIVALAGPHQYARFASAFRGVRDVSAMGVPGFLAAERLPATAEVLVDLQVRALLEHVGDRFVLLGSSGGGLLAHAAARRLEAIGRPPEAVVLLDTYPPGSVELSRQQNPLIEGMFDRDETFVRMDGARFSAMGWYFHLFGKWEPEPIASPTLLVRATDPLVHLAADQEWRSNWHLADAVLEVPGNHFTIMEEHAANTAAVVRDWLAARGC
jgi:thioesterase domain-containing protein